MVCGVYMTYNDYILMSSGFVVNDVITGARVC